MIDRKIGERAIHKSFPELGLMTFSRFQPDGKAIFKRENGKEIVFPLDASDLEWREKALRSWSPKATNFYRECFEYLIENQPLTEPFGRDGKNSQAAWREKNGLSTIDPVLSNLSMWGRGLVDRGYMKQCFDGRWTATEKVWSE